MKNIFILCFAANLITDGISFMLLGDMPAVHFAMDGSPNGWFSASGSLIFNLLFHTLFFFLLYYSGTLITKTPKFMVNIPNKDYWLKPENIAVCKQRWENCIYSFAAALMLFFLSITIIIVEANFSDPIRLNNTLFIAATGLFGGFMIYWIFLLYKVFRIPD